MIVYNELDLKGYFIDKLSIYSVSENMAVILVDPYFGGRKIFHEERINAFLDFIMQLFSQPRIIWFYNSANWEPMESESVLSIDLFRHGIRVHDCFLLLYDGNEKRYVGHFHLGGSINAFDINGNSTIPIMRISRLQGDEVFEIESLIGNLERVYSNNTTKMNWGC